MILHTFPHINLTLTMLHRKRTGLLRGRTLLVAECRTTMISMYVTGKASFNKITISRLDP
jgi:hypothetical protein